MDAKTLTRDLLKFHGHNAVLSLDIEGDKSKKKHYALIKDIQTDPITDAVLHVDFLEIELEKEIVMEVPDCIYRNCKRVDLGGILNIMAHTVKIKGLPLDILDEITVDVTSLEVGAPVLPAEICQYQIMLPLKKNWVGSVFQLLHQRLRLKKKLKKRK